ncbi:putative phage abortive infection protein [Pedobacter sp. D749]|uniref:putative phage abortive infection protein n=1 Tax=Pedobacter sp. D749 TaxID=2856523 RepID=UPI001C596C41|nr:putative phage abortive infection protein [Pedobacter sp. D749]QXU43469.1 putative phage abortive infection protein [Pedobacter sp. D749]
MKTLLLWASALLTVLGIGISVYFFYALSAPFEINGEGEWMMDVTGQVGDFIGGIVGTLFALTGTALIYLSFREQTTQNKREAFEAAFFEMLRLHRENVAEMRLSRSLSDHQELAENRKVFRLIYAEFMECYFEVKKFFRKTDDYILPKYQAELKRIADRISPYIDVKEMAMIDTAYCIVFFGIGNEGEQVLTHRFRSRYNNAHFRELLAYIKLKPQREDEKRFQNFVYFRSLPVSAQRAKIRELYDYKRRATITNPTLSDDELRFLARNDYTKYYGGHQHRLGHYFRHLFQTYKYLHYHHNLDRKEKYLYGKTLRAQLSTYEQALFFINSISTLGMKWELLAEYKRTENMDEDQVDKLRRKNHLITEYNLIKNLPGESLFGFRYRTYYPEIKYESEE